MSILPRLRWTFAASLYGRSHRCPSPSLQCEKFLKIIPQQHSLRKYVLIWKVTGQSPVVPANLKYSTILWFTLLLLYCFLIIFWYWTVPVLLSFPLRCSRNDLQATFPLDHRVNNATTLSHACNLGIIFNSYSSPRCHFPVTLKLHTY